MTAQIKTISSRKPHISRKDRLLQELVHDPYKTRRKLGDSTICPVCKAIYRDGRWQWADSWPIDAREETCRACNRTRDNYPAGIVTLNGPFLQAHRDEILNLVRHHEEEENSEHPLHRLMGIDQQPAAMVIKTTDIHLPRRIGEALRRAFKGELDVHYDEEGYFVRVKWRRDSS